jgi:diguanylate cyclase (GGDEF)-like protein
LDIKTLFLTIVLLSATLALTVGLVARRDRRDGLLLWALGLAAHTLAYLLLSRRGQAPALLTVWLANGLLATTFALFTESLCRFLGLHPRHGLIWLPVALTLATFGALLDNDHARLLAGPLIFSLQILVLLVLLASAWRATVGRGQHIVFAGLALMLAVLVLRALAALGGHLDTRLLSASGPVQSTTFLVVLVSLVMSSFGFVLMYMERADDRNRRLALIDEGTGLPNRRSILQSLAQQMAAARRSRQPLTLLMLDIDHFKRINDEHGHLQGDAALRHVAQTLQQRLRGQDLLGRFGGEEFLALAPGIGADPDGLHLADALRTTVAARPVNIDGGRAMKLTVSVGVAELGPDDATSLEALISAADAALYRAKELGRNRIEQARRPPGPVPGELAGA